jgi:hypothetical protein
MPALINNCQQLSSHVSKCQHLSAIVSTYQQPSSHASNCQQPPAHVTHQQPSATCHRLVVVTPCTVMACHDHHSPALINTTHHQFPSTVATPSAPHITNTHMYSGRGAAPL